MKTFRQILTEKPNLKSKVLYHTTTFDAAKNILNHNYFRPSQNSETRKSGLSTTTDKKYFWASKNIRFVLDYNKIKKDYKTIPVEGIIKGLDESEILILSDKAIINASKYIIRIDINKNPPIDFLNILNKYIEKYNIKVGKI